MRVRRKAPMGGRSLKSTIGMPGLPATVRPALGREAEDSRGVRTEAEPARLVLLEGDRLELLDALLQRPDRIAAGVQEPMLEVVVGRAQVLLRAGRVGDMKIEIGDQMHVPALE